MMVMVRSILSSRLEGFSGLQDGRIFGYRGRGQLGLDKLLARGTEEASSPVVLALSGRPGAASYVHAWAGMGSGVHKTTSRARLWPGSFISLHIHPTPQDVEPPPRGVKGLRSHPRASQRRIY